MEYQVEDPVLVVGSGGIGCELLKNLVLSGFTNIHVIDLDVIELSNLNRQFLFRRHHIGQPKCKIAAEAVMALNPKASVVPHWANVKDTKLFPLSFFLGFRIVLNALDNIGKAAAYSSHQSRIDARRYVNNMCLSARVPLVESGTAGYLGQTSVIIPVTHSLHDLANLGKSECFDCIPKEQPKTFPVCTIRTTPSAPIHCIIWAKDYLLVNLFGETVEENYPQGEDETVIASLKRETEAFAALRQMAASHDPEYAQQIFNKVFKDDIASLLGLKDLWEGGRTPPVPMTVNMVDIEPVDTSTMNDHVVWSIVEWIALFHSSLGRLCDRAFAAEFVPIEFDKDDEDAMDLVAATANIRAHIFAIPMCSRFALKSIAGNIIPAIATTNAIVAGMIVLQAQNILLGKLDKCSTAFVTYGTRRGTLFARESLNEPSRGCTVCNVDRAIVRLIPSQVSLECFLDSAISLYSDKIGIEILKDQVTVLEGSRILYDEDIPGNINKSLEALGCGDSRFVKLDFLTSDIPLLVVIDGISPLVGSECIEFDFALLSDSMRVRVETCTDDGLGLATCALQDQESLEPPSKLTKFSAVSDDDDAEVIIL